MMFFAATSLAALLRKPYLGKFVVARPVILKHANSPFLIVLPSLMFAYLCEKSLRQK